MAVAWTPHRFAGGRLILDLANTVVLRGDNARGFDRLDDRSEIARFASAASRMRSEELGARPLVVDDVDAAAERIIGFREAADLLFRTAATDGAYRSRHLGDVLSRAGAALVAADERLSETHRPAGRAPAPIGLETALAVSTLSLIPQGPAGRIRVCANCGWLFLDSSRNRSRIWCDMAVCGNRQKARRHYRSRNRKGDDHA